MNMGAVEYWRVLARRFANASHILGYELMNEPDFLCDDFADGGNCTSPEDWMSGSFGLRYMAPFYNQLINAIRGEGANQTIFFEMPLNLPFFDAELSQRSSLQYAFHAYCLPGDDGTSYFVDGLCSFVQAFQGAWIRVLRWVPPILLQGFVTEFGAVGDTKAELDHMGSWLDFADTMLESWAYWEYKNFRDITTQNYNESFYDGKGNLETDKVRALTRTYAKATAGIPTHMYYNRQTQFFHLRFMASPRARDARAPTEIYLNKEMHYPHGYETSVAPSGCTTKEFSKNHVYIYLKKVSSFNMTMRCSMIEVNITAKEQKQHKHR